MRRFFAAAGLTMLTLPCLVLAAPPAEGHEAPKAGVLPTIEQGIVPMIVSLLVFAVVFAVLAAKVWPTISKGLADREAKILSEIKSAEIARSQAEAALKNYEKSLNEARAEAQRMLEQARVQQQAQAAEARARADAEIAGLKEKAMRDIDAAKKQALSDIYAEAAGLGTMIAGKILKREVNAQDQGRLVQDALHEMKAQPARA